MQKGLNRWCPSLFINYLLISHQAGNFIGKVNRVFRYLWGVVMNNNLFSKFTPMSLAMFTKNKMLYSEYQPCQELSLFINCYWISPVIDTLGEYIYNSKDEIIIPDGCLDVIFEVNKQSNEYSCFVIGTMSRPIITSTNFSDTQIYAIRFNPTGAYPFLKSQLNNFTDLMVELNHVSKKLERELAKIFLSNNSISEKIRSLDKFFCSYFAAEKKANAIVMNALASI